MTAYIIIVIFILQLLLLLYFEKYEYTMYSFIKKNPNYGEDIVLPFRIQKFPLDTTGLESENFYADCWPIVRYLDSSRTIQPYLCISGPLRNCA
jgi:hypothetical protein